MSRYLILNFFFGIAALGLIFFSDLIHHVWIYWLIIILISSVITVIGVFKMSLGLFINSICHGKRDSRDVALTFDDGPVAGNSESVLDILAQYDVKAAFFCVGNRVKEQPDIARRMIADGHIIGNHSYFHEPAFTWNNKTKVRSELLDTNDVIEQETMLRPRFFRPPYGITNPMIAYAVKEGNYLSIGWSVRSFDTVSKDRMKLCRRITKGLKGGDIILLHDRCQITVEILPELITHIRKIGFNFVRVDQLIGEKPYFAKDSNSNAEKLHDHT